ncbi:hypothetical protein N9D70_02700 [bacterium]|nr:hypothetical protein [bacterium]
MHVKCWAYRIEEGPRSVATIFSTPLLIFVGRMVLILVTFNPPKMSDRQVRNAMARLECGEMRKDVAHRYGVHPWTLTRAIQRLEGNK